MDLSMLIRVNRWLEPILSRLLSRERPATAPLNIVSEGGGMADLPRSIRVLAMTDHRGAHECK